MPNTRTSDSGQKYCVLWCESTRMFRNRAHEGLLMVNSCTSRVLFAVKRPSTVHAFVGNCCEPSTTTSLNVDE